MAHLMCPVPAKQSASCIDPLHDKHLPLFPPGSAQRNSTHSAPFPVLQSASCIDPLHDKRLRSFRPALSQFWRALVSELYAAEELLDDFLQERLTGLLISLSW